MSHLRRLFISLFAAASFGSCCVFGAWAEGEGQASAASAEEEAEAPAGEAEADRARFKELEADLAAALAEGAALDADAAAASGEDEAALRDRGLELRLDAVHTLGEMVEVSLRLRERGDDASAAVRAVAAALPDAGRSIQSDFRLQLAELDRIKTARDGASDDAAAAALEPAIQRREQDLLQILDEAVGLLEMAVSLQLPAGVDRAWLVGRIGERARLSTSHLGLARHRLEDVAAQIDAGADAAALLPEESAARLRLGAASQNLESLVDMMGRLEIDASSYQQLLVESTGELTIDAIDSDVAGDLVARWLGDVQEDVAANGPQFAFQAILFALIFTVFWALSRFTRRIVSRAVEAPHLRFSELLKRMVVSLSAGAIILIGLLIALSQLGIEVAPMLAGLGIAGFVLGFALQDTLGNFAAGVMILLYRPFDVGDMIDCAGGVFGNVSHMSLVSTTILTIDNKTLIVPNSKIWGDVITNVTAQANRRVDLEFGIGYGDDIPKAEAVLESIMKEHPMILADPEPVVKVHALGDSSVNFVVRPWCAVDDYWDVFWDVTREVKLRFDREGVSIPFPQRDVHFYPAEPNPPGTGAASHAPGAMAVEATSASSHSNPDADED